MPKKPETQEICPEWTKERPNFGRRQVRTLKGLKFGQMYLLKSAGCSRLQHIQIIKEPYQNADRDWLVNIRLFRGNVPFGTTSLLLALVSLYPLKNGDWNTQNCILRIVNN